MFTAWRKPIRPLRTIGGEELCVIEEKFDLGFNFSITRLRNYQITTETGALERER